MIESTLLESSDLIALFTTLKMAFVTTIILMVIGTPLAWYLAKMKSRFKIAIEAIVALPIVLPLPYWVFIYLLLFHLSTYQGSYGKVLQDNSLLLVLAP